MKHQYEDYIKWIDRTKLILESKISDEKVTDYPDLEWIKEAECLNASLLANKATLERHNPDNNRPVRYCPTCADEVDNYQEGDWLYVRIESPCPSLLDVTNQLDEVME